MHADCSRLPPPDFISGEDAPCQIILKIIFISDYLTGLKRRKDLFLFFFKTYGFA